MRFTAIDVETANPDMSSICQIGLAVFEDGVLINEWCSLIDPEDYFYHANKAVHGIDESYVHGQPKMPDVEPVLRNYLENTVVVCHTSFDRNSLLFALEKYKLPPIETTWLDSARVVRRTWHDLSRKGYGLANVCQKIGHDFQHHNALEDAKAAGHVLLAATKESGLGIDQWIDRLNKPVKYARKPDLESIARTGDTEGDFFGEVLVFTGELKIPRKDAADLAARSGCQVDSGVTKKTTILVVGDQDAKRLAGHNKSSKHRKAEELIAAGQKIRVIRECDFQKMLT